MRRPSLPLRETSALLLLLVVVQLLLLPSCFVDGAATFSVCGSGCDYATVEAALNATTQATTINVQPGTYTQAYTSPVHNDVVLNLLGAVTIVTPASNSSNPTYWISVYYVNLVIQGGSLTLVHGGIQVLEYTPSVTLSTTLTIVNGTTGLTLARTHFIQNGDITANMIVPDVPVLYSKGAVWDQYGDMNLTCPDDVYCRAVFLDNSNNWNQHAGGSLTTQFHQGNPVQVYYLGVWQQEGDVSIECGNCTGIAVYNRFTWNQTGDVSVNVLGPAGLGIDSVFGDWTQGGKLDITVGDQADALAINAVTWNQTDTVNIRVGQQSRGVHFLSRAAWIQQNDVTIVTGASSTGVFFDPAYAVSGGANFSWSVGGTASIFVNSSGMGVNNGLNSPLTVSDTLFISATNDAAYAINYPSQELSCCSGCAADYSITWNNQGVNYGGCTPSTPTASPSFNPSPSATPSNSPAPSATPSPSPTPTPSTSATPSPSPTSSPAYFQSSTTAIAAVPVLRFNYTAPQLAILPKSEEDKIETRAAVGVALEAVVEVASSNDSSPLATTYCVNGTWNATDAAQVIAGATQSFTYSCLLVDNNATTAASDAVAMEMQFDLFDTTTNVALHDLVNLTITPSLTKFSLRMRGRWPWRSSESRLQLRMAINPTFSSAVLVETVNGTTASNNESSSLAVARATTWRLEGQKAAEGLKRSVATLVRLVNVVDLDGETRVGDEWIIYTLEPTSDSSASSGLVVSFGQFNESLSYDPDLGVLLGRSARNDDSGSDDHLAVIIGVSVAVPVAILVVVVVVVAAVSVHWYRRASVAREYRNKESSVNFHHHDAL